MQPSFLSNFDRRKLILKKTKPTKQPFKNFFGRSVLYHVALIWDVLYLNWETIYKVKHWIQPMNEKNPEALRINTLSDIKKRILLLRNCSYVMLIIDPLPCIIHIKSSKQNTVLCRLCKHTKKWDDWNDGSPTVIFTFRE